MHSAERRVDVLLNANLKCVVNRTPNRIADHDLAEIGVTPGECESAVRGYKGGQLSVPGASQPVRTEVKNVDRSRRVRPCRARPRGIVGANDKRLLQRVTWTAAIL